MAEFAGPIPLEEREITRALPASPGTFALGYARPHEGAVFISFVGRADRDLSEALRDHLGGPYSACFWHETATPEAAYRVECELWHEMGGAEGDLDSDQHPLPPGDFACPVCE